MPKTTKTRKRDVSACQDLDQPATKAPNTAQRAEKTDSLTSGMVQKNESTPHTKESKLAWKSKTIILTKPKTPVKAAIAQVKPVQIMEANSPCSTSLTSSFSEWLQDLQDRPPTPRSSRSYIVPSISIVPREHSHSLIPNHEWETHSEPDIDGGLDFSTPPGATSESDSKDDAQTQTTIITLSDSSDESNIDLDDERETEEKLRRDQKRLFMNILDSVQEMKAKAGEPSHYNIFSPDLPLVELMKSVTNDLQKRIYSPEEIRKMIAHVPHILNEIGTFISCLSTKEGFTVTLKEAIIDATKTLQTTLRRKRLIVSSSEESDDNHEIKTMLAQPRRSILCANCHEVFASKAALRRHLFKNSTDCSRSNSCK